MGCRPSACCYQAAAELPVETAVQPADLEAEEGDAEPQAESKWDKPKWRASPLKAALRDTVLVDAQWLVDLAASGGTVPRCQDLPIEAMVSLQEMEAWKGESIGVVVLSYPWLDADHPDRNGEQLRRFAPVLKVWALLAKKAPGCRAGVFWDYCSLPQTSREARRRGQDDRTREEKVRFKRGLKGINAWYGHPLTTVLLATAPLPTDATYANTQPYGGRGWCVAERAMCCIVKNSACLIDLSQLRGNEQSIDHVRRAGKTARPPPQSPAAFRQMLQAGVADGSIKFTNKGDVDAVADIYQRAFVVEMSGATTLTYHLGWDAAAAATFAEALRSAHADHGALQSVQKLSLVENTVGGRGAAALAEAFAQGALPGLQELYLQKNEIGDEGLCALAGAFARGALPVLEVLHVYEDMGSGTVGDDGMRALAGALAAGALPRLRNLSLRCNQIGPEGTKALADAAVKGALVDLKKLALNMNQIGDEGAVALAIALANGAMPNLNDLGVAYNGLSADGMDVVFRGVRGRRMKLEIREFEQVQDFDD